MNLKNKRPIVLAITGCSGSGKSLITKIIMKKIEAKCPLHTTTRRMRKDDSNFYKYVSRQEFLEMEKNKLFYVSSGDRKRCYGVELKEMKKVQTDSNIQIINISLKDIDYLANYKEVFFIQTKYKRFFPDFFINGIIKKVGWYESICRFFIYIHDWIKYKESIKKYITYNIIFDKDYNKICESIDKILFDITNRGDE